MERISTLGRRKRAVARILFKKGNGEIVVNSKNYKQYFKVVAMQNMVESPIVLLDMKGKYDVTALIDGGGYKGQAEALRLAISRAFCKLNAEFRPALKAQGFLIRDPREVERKKPGHKKARKSFQFSKR